MGIIVLEGLPASGKTTLANLIRDRLGFVKINESLGQLTGINLIDDQKTIFQETVKKYRLAKNCVQNSIIDRGYPSLLAWDYCAKKLGYANDLAEKNKWIKNALATGELFEPTLYIYLVESPELSLNRRPRKCQKNDVWSGTRGMIYCAEFYENFFNQDDIALKTIKIDAIKSTNAILREIKEKLSPTQ